jgi:hypothetical protein
MNKEHLFTVFSNIYGEPSYFQENKHIILQCVFYFILLIGICSYIHYLTNVDEIKNNWAKHRCKMTIIPFAGWINAPTDKSPNEYTSENFTFCVQNMVTTFTQYLLLPINFIISIVTIFFTLLAQSVNNIRERIYLLKQTVLNLVNEIYNRIVNIIIPFNIIFIKFEDIMGKLKGVLATMMYSILGVYYTIKSTMGVILDFVIAILVTLTVILAGLIATASVFAATAFINPLSAVMLPILMTMITSYVMLFLSISIPSLMIMVFCVQYLKMQSKTFPSLPTCFDKSVNVKFSENTFKNIYYIKPGDILYDDNKVDAIIMCAMTEKQTIFCLNNDLVTSYHRVYYDIDEPRWVYVKDHPDSKEMKLNPDVVYCLTTSKKNIITQMNEYLDWDDNTVSNADIENCFNRCEFINMRQGFEWDTLIIFLNKTLTPIYKIKIGDILCGGYKVIGIVLICRDTDKHTSEKSLWEENVEDYKNNYNFHLITTSGMFHIFSDGKGMMTNDYSDSEYTDVKKCPM